MYAFLFRAEDTVARISQTGNNVAVIVEAFVQRCAVNGDVGVILIDSANTLGSRKNVDATDVLDTLVLQQGDRRRGGAARCQHGVNQEDVSFFNVRGKPDSRLVPKSSKKSTIKLSIMTASR